MYLAISFSLSVNEIIWVYGERNNVFKDFSAKKISWRRGMPWFTSCSRHVGDSRWCGSLTMTLAGSKAKWLSSINHTTKTIHHHHCHAQHVSDTLQLSQRQTSLKRHILAKNLFRRHVFCKVFHTKPLLAEIWSKYKQLCCSFMRFLNLDNRYFSLTTSLFSD